MCVCVCMRVWVCLCTRLLSKYAQWHKRRKCIPASAPWWGLKAVTAEAWAFSLYLDKNNPATHGCWRDSLCIYIMHPRATAETRLMLGVQMRPVLQEAFTQPLGKKLISSLPSGGSIYCRRHRFVSVKRVFLNYFIPSTDSNMTADVKIKQFEMSKGTPVLSLLNVCNNQKSWEMHNNLIKRVKSNQAWSDSQ